MRVLHIGKYFPPVKGGIERFVADLVNAQRAAGIESFALVHGHPGGGRIADPAWLRRVPVWREVSFAPLAPSFLREIDLAIDHWQPEYLHLHVPNLSALAVFASKRARRLPWVIHWHSDVVSSMHSLSLRILYPFYRPFERALLERAALVICTSQQYLETSEPLQPYREKCVAIPLGLDVARLARDRARTQPVRPWGDGRFRVLAVGRLTYYKGFDTLIRACAQVLDAELRIVGGGEERAQLAALIAKLGVADRIKLEGAATDADCAALYGSADLFCLPSRERTEAFGIVLLEAMHFKLPVLASAIPGSGVSAVVKHGITGYLLPIDEHAAWRDGIIALMKAPADRERLAAAGYKRVLQAYEIGQVERRLNRTLLATLAPDAARPEAHERPLVVIPARDEATTIGALITEIRSLGYDDVLVIDDRSIDETGRVARETGAKVLRAPLPQGAWGAMQCGMRYAIRHSFTSVITMDADGQHRPHEIERLLRAARHADVVIGACPRRGSTARKLAWKLFRLLTGFTLSDLTSGFRLYNAAACRALAGDEATLIDFQDMGVLLRLRQAGLTFAEVEVNMLNRVVGQSRIFYSWWAVAIYMVETCIICAARRGLRRKKTGAIRRIPI